MGNWNCVEGAESCGKGLILLLQSLHKLDLWFLSKETMKTFEKQQQKALKTKKLAALKNTLGLGENMYLNILK